MQLFVDMGDMGSWGCTHLGSRKGLASKGRYRTPDAEAMTAALDLQTMFWLLASFMMIVCACKECWCPNEPNDSIPNDAHTYSVGEEATEDEPDETNPFPIVHRRRAA